jgi:hypothetical protein
MELEMHSQRWDLEIFGTQAGVYYHVKRNLKFVSSLLVLLYKKL